MTNNMDPFKQSDLGPCCLLLYLNSSLMLGNYLQQTTSADDSWRRIFSWPLRAKGCESSPSLIQSNINSAFWENFMLLLSSADLINIIKNIINTIRVSNGLYFDHGRRSVGPDMGPNCLPRLSVDDISRR